MNASFDPVRVGVIGVGDISDVYLRMIDRSPALSLVAIAARDVARVADRAAAFGTTAMTFDAMLADPAIELIVDLTPAAAHEEVNARILNAGKHLYSEKPFALSLDAARDLAALAQARSLLVGGAPDTFYGAAHQAAAAWIDRGEGGRPVFGIGFVGLPGIEMFHPAPQGFYRAGGESPLDIGPYHLLQWVMLLGPVRRVACAASHGPATRRVRVGPQAGDEFSVEVPTSFSALLWFDDAHVTLTTSLDVTAPTPRPSELHCTDSVVELADPNFFGGAPRARLAGGREATIDFADRPFGAPNRTDHRGQPVADYRGVGIVELALAVRGLAQHRASLALITHVTEVATAIVAAAQTQEVVAISSACERPAAIGTQPWDVMLQAMTPSPH